LFDANPDGGGFIETGEYDGKFGYLQRPGTAKFRC
jgi:hypothetical protein